MPLPPLPDATEPAWRHAAGEASAPAPDLRGWWHVFGDPALDRLVDAALEDNLTIAQARLRIEAARVLDARGQATFLPQVGFHTFAEPTPDSSASYFQAGFDARWELGLFGRSQARARVTAADLGLAETEAQAARVSVVAEVARTWIELRGAQQRLRFAGEIADAAHSRRELTATRERLHLATSTDLAHAASEAEVADAALAEPRAAIERARERLRVLLGGSLPPDLPAGGDPPRLGDVAIASAPADLLRTRPEIRRAEYEVLKAAGERGLAHADQFPHVGLGGALTYAAKVIGHTRLSDADGIVTFGPAIDIPLFDWGMRRATLEARDAELSASLLGYREAVLEGVAEAETALATLAQQRERAAALARSLANLQQAAASGTTLRRLGLADGLDQASAHAALAQAQLDLAQAEQERSIAFIALYKALGGAPLPPSAKRVATADDRARASAPVHADARASQPVAPAAAARDAMPSGGGSR